MQKLSKPTNVQETQRKVNELHNQIKDIGSVNIDSIEEYKKIKKDMRQWESNVLILKIQWLN